jgi:hypothetical protein
MMDPAPAGPGDGCPTVVDQIIDAGNSLYRVRVITPDGVIRWVQIPAGKATLTFVRVSAAAYAFLLARGLVEL